MTNHQSLPTNPFLGYESLVMTQWHIRSRKSSIFKVLKLLGNRKPETRIFDSSSVPDTRPPLP
ncbi:hypothetical protein [Scytonema sp. HK-05]|uniref:hypothetical protein n=1 Tax=Scytonema sp. HK-05 TaxID=1137095 RepID=UPI0011612759|nr:hypothetical protein [Scytonema sp. HK-05]